MTTHDAYHQFMIKNASRIAALENVLRSVSYIIPGINCQSDMINEWIGRFEDSEFAAEVLYSSLNLLRLINESAIIRSRRAKGEGVGKGAWNAYIMFLRRKSKLLDTLLTFLNIAWTIEVPLEMLIERFLGLSSKYRYVVILEMSKAASRLFVFWSSGFRPVLRNFLPDVSLEPGAYQAIHEKDTFSELMTEIACNGEGKEDDVIRNYLKKHRIDSYVLVPELSVTPTLSWINRAREVAHILRPLIYASLLATSLGRGARNGGKIRWVAWSASLAMDIFSEWPQIVSLIRGVTGERSKDSPIEKNEKQIRMIKLLLYLLREPLYSWASKHYIESVTETLGKWRIFRPAIGMQI